jgi:putative cardiolipin synthase
MDDGVKPENSYQVLLDDDGDLYWITQKDGVEIRYDSEPETTLGQRLMSKIIEMLPVQSQL